MQLPCFLSMAVAIVLIDITSFLNHSKLAGFPGFFPQHVGARQPSNLRFVGANLRVLLENLELGISRSKHIHAFGVMLKDFVDDLTLESPWGWRILGARHKAAEDILAPGHF